MHIYYALCLIYKKKTSVPYRAYVSKISSFIELNHFPQAVLSEWRKAMTEELQALEDNETWFVVPLASGKQQLVVDVHYRT